MWTHFRLAPNLVVAEAWREVIEDQGVPCQIWPLDPAHETGPEASERMLRLLGVVFTPYQVVVPNDRVHVAGLVVQHA